MRCQQRAVNCVIWRINWWYVIPQIGYTKYSFATSYWSVCSDFDDCQSKSRDQALHRLSIGQLLVEFLSNVVVWFVHKVISTAHGLPRRRWRFLLQGLAFSRHSLGQPDTDRNWSSVNLTYWSTSHEIDSRCWVTLAIAVLGSRL